MDHGDGVGGDDKHGVCGRERKRGGQEEMEEEVSGRDRDSGEAEEKMKERAGNEQGWLLGGEGARSALRVILNYCPMFSVSICSLISCVTH